MLALAPGCLLALQLLALCLLVLLTFTRGPLGGRVRGGTLQRASLLLDAHQIREVDCN